MTNKSQPEQTKVKKPRKYNPKRNKVCVGEFLAGLYTHMQDVLKENKADLKELAVANWLMNMTMLETTQQWCRCTWCGHMSKRLLDYLKPLEKRKEEE